MSPNSRRQIWLAAHRYTGVAMALFLTVAGVTGCLLCFEKPLDRWLNPDLFRPRFAGIIDPALAVKALEERSPALVVTAFPLRAVTGRNIVVQVAARPGAPPLGFDQVFLDGGDGRIDGYRRTEAGWDRAHLMRGVYLAHYTLLAGAPGRWLMGIIAVAWLVSNLIGLYLLWPRRGRFWRELARAGSVNVKAKAPRLWLDLHKAGGLWLLAPLCVLALTSAAMNFFDEAVTPAVQALSPPLSSPFDSPPPAKPAARTIGFDAAIRIAIARAATLRPGWRPAVAQYEPDRNLVGVRFTRSGLETYRGLGPVTYWLDGETGRLVSVDDPYRDSAGKAAERALYPLHTGEMIGWPGVALDLGLGIATIGLGVTGLYLWLARRPGRKAMASRKLVSAT